MNLDKIYETKLSNIRTMTLNGEFDRESLIISSCLSELASYETSFIEKAISILFHKRKFYATLKLCKQTKINTSPANYFTSVITGFFLPDFQTAITAINACLEKQPENIEFIRTKALIYIYNLRLNDAKSMLEKIQDENLRSEISNLVQKSAIIPTSSTPQVWDRYTDSLSEPEIMSLIRDGRYTQYYIALLYTVKKLSLTTENGFNFQAAYAYALIKLDLKHELCMLTQSHSNKKLEWAALKSYSDRWAGNYSEIYNTLKSHLPCPAEKFDIYYSLAFECLAEALLHLDLASELERLVIDDRKINDSKSWNLLYSGLLNHLKGHDNYYLQWESAAANNSFILNHSWGANSYGASGRSNFNNIRYTQDSSRILEGCPTVLMSCDINYLRLYLKNTKRNAASMPNINWHLHVIVDQDCETDFSEQLISENPEIHFSFEFHSAPLPRAYYTMARFLYCYNNIETISFPLLIIDIDSALINKNSLMEIINTNNTDFGIKVAPYYHHFPWHKFQASGTALYNKKSTFELLTHIKSWFEENFNTSNTNQWWIDQVALFEAHKQLKDTYSFSDIFFNINNAFEFAKANPAAKRDMAKKFDQD